MGGGRNSGALWGSALGSLANAGTSILMFKSLMGKDDPQTASPDNPIPTAGSEMLGPPTAANAGPRTHSAGGTPLLSGPMTPDDIRSHIFGNASEYAGKPQAIAAAFQRMQVPADEKMINSLATEVQDYLDIQTAKQEKALAASKRRPNRDSVGTSQHLQPYVNPPNTDAATNAFLQSLYPRGPR